MLLRNTQFFDRDLRDVGEVDQAEGVVERPIGAVERDVFQGDATLWADIGDERAIIAEPQRRSARRADEMRAFRQRDAADRRHAGLQPAGPALEGGLVQLGGERLGRGDRRNGLRPSQRGVKGERSRRARSRSKKAAPVGRNMQEDHDGRQNMNPRAVRAGRQLGRKRPPAH